jgi:VanZ like family
MTSAFRLASAVLFVAIVVATLGPVGLRPQTGQPGLERLVAFAALGAVLVPAFPSRFWTVLMVVVAAAICLELLQLVVPGRDARVVDGAVKAAGGALGCLVGQALCKILPSRG